MRAVTPRAVSPGGERGTLWDVALLQEWRKLALCGLALVAVAVPLASSGECELPETVFPTRRIDAWSLALRLGRADRARIVYATLPADARAQHFILEATPGQVIQVDLGTPAAEPAAASPLKMALSGPGLPPGEHPRWIRLLPGEGVILSRRVDGGTAIRRDTLTETRYRVRERLRTRAPARGQYVLSVYRQRRGETAYRLLMAGTCERGIGALLRLPVAWFRANYAEWPNRALARLLAVIVGAAALIGLWYLGAQRRITERGGFVR